MPFMSGIKNLAPKKAFSYFCPPGLQYRQEKLFFHNQDLLAFHFNKRRKTPYYLYAPPLFSQRLQEFKVTAKKYFPRTKIFYALKANHHPFVFPILRKHAIGLDVVSGAELSCGLKQGIVAKKIVFSGVAKSREELSLAIKAQDTGIASLNVESLNELQNIIRLGHKFNLKNINISLRFNPKVEIETHPYLKTSQEENKFGLTAEEIFQALELIRKESRISLVGLSVHLGSNLKRKKDFSRGYKIFNNLALKVNQLYPLKMLNLGGGLGIDYQAHENSLDLESYFKTISQCLAPQWSHQKTWIAFEPGRWIAAHAGVLITQKILTKENFYFIDAGIHSFMRQALYRAYHPLLPLVHQTTAPQKQYDVVGPTCESSDHYGTHLLPRDHESSLLALALTGAYGEVFKNAYNLKKTSSYTL